jgi:flagellar hook-associated protein 3 FlgL
MDRISTFNLRSANVGNAMNVQTQLANVQYQESSGLVAQNFGDLGGHGTFQMLNFETELNQAQTWATQAQQAGSKTQSIYTAVGAMATTMTNLQTRLSTAQTGIDNSGLADAVKSLQSQLQQSMNVQLGGSYLFAGSNTDTAPVDLTNYPTLDTSTTPPSYDPTTPDTSYYKGDSTILSVRVATQQKIAYGLTADNPVFEKAMRIMQTALQAAQASPIDKATLNQAYSDCADCITKLANLQESVADVSSQLKSAQQTQTNYATFLSNAVSDVKNVDAAQVASQLSLYQTQLQASYLAVASVTKVTLTSYL